MKTSVRCCATGARLSIVKAGHHGSGTQPHLCKACGAPRVPAAKRPATDPTRKAMILRAVEVERLSLRGAERVFGVARQTVAKGLEKKPKLARRRATHSILPRKGTRSNSMSFGVSWAANSTPAGCGSRSAARPARWSPIISEIVPLRAPAPCGQRIPPDCRCRATRRDFWLAYDEVFARRTHRCTGKGAGETCYVERWKNTPRQRPGRFVRKTRSFSKCDRMHEVALRLFVQHHNLSLSP